MGQTVQIAAHRRTEHQRLDVVADVLHDLLYLGLEAQLQELVGLVENQHLQVLDAHAPRIEQQVDDAAWSANHQLRVVSQRHLLLLDRTRSDYQGCLQLRVLVQFLKLLVNLDSQLPSGSHYQGSDVAHRCHIKISLDYWHQKSRSLP